MVPNGVMIYDLNLKKLTYGNKEMWTIIGFTEHLQTFSQEHKTRQLNESLMRKIENFTTSEKVPFQNASEIKNSDASNEMLEVINLWQFITL